MSHSVGRSRDPDIDDRLLKAAVRQLSVHGYESMSLSAVAEEAGTTRQALYRRWQDKAELAGAVLAYLADTTPGAESEDPFVDLVAELANFRKGVSQPGRLSLVGSMLQDQTDPDVRARYRAQVVAPRRRRLRATLDRAQALGLFDPDADIDIALTMCTGSWYGRALASDTVPRNWALRTATLVWRSLGGQLPDDAPSGRGRSAPAGRRLRAGFEMPARKVSR